MRLLRGMQKPSDWEQHRLHDLSVGLEQEKGIHGEDAQELIPTQGLRVLWRRGASPRCMCCGGELDASNTGVSALGKREGQEGLSRSTSATSQVEAETKSQKRLTM